MSDRPPEADRAEESLTTEQASPEAAPSGEAPAETSPPATPEPRPVEPAADTPAPEPKPEPAVAQPGAPTPEPATLGGAAAADAEAAMRAATEGPPGANAPTAPDTDAEHHKPAIRGPRVVQGGREYRKGVVVSVGPEDVFLEFGPKELGVVSRAGLKDEDLPKTGDDLEVVVERFQPEESLYLCSLPGQVQKADWEMLEKGQVVEATVTGTNKGGLELEVAHHRAFMPASQVDVHRVEDLTQFVGQKLTCQVTRVDRFGRGNITLSRRAVLAEERAQHVEEIKNSLKEGDEIEGTVRKIMPFGAFVDMGGVDGLVHVSDMAHDRVEKPESVVNEGDTVRVKILRLDWEKGRHSLGMKQLEPDPWEVALAEIKEEEVITGRVTKLLDFGCFVEIAPGLEGLVHISELDWKRVAKTSDAVQPNNTVSVKVLKIDRDKKKISLSIKQAKDRPPAPAGRGGPGGRGRGRGRDEVDNRKAEEILKETPEFRRLREKAAQRGGAAAKKKETAPSDKPGGLGDGGGMGLGLGDLKLPG
jgi:predicted RNA-binding protein with RPS1 domain